MRITHFMEEAWHKDPEVYITLEDIVSTGLAYVGYWCTGYYEDTDPETGSVTTRTFETIDGLTKTVTNEEIWRAVCEWAWTNAGRYDTYATRAAWSLLRCDWWNLDLDAEISDEIIQIAVLGELVYG